MSAVSFCASSLSGFFPEQTAETQLPFLPRDLFFIAFSWNRDAFSQIRFRPRVLRNVLPVDLSTSILGHRSRMPIYISPAAMGRLAHPEGEKCLVRTAAAHGIPYVVCAFRFAFLRGRPRRRTECVFDADGCRCLSRSRPTRPSALRTLRQKSRKTPSCSTKLVARSAFFRSDRVQAAHSPWCCPVVRQPRPLEERRHLAKGGARWLQGEATVRGSSSYTRSSS